MVKPLTKNSVLILVVLLSNFGRAQNNVLLDTLKVRQIAQDEGLSQLNVLSMDFDDHGYLWAGTEDGLNRFNAYFMKVLSQNGTALPDDHIRGLVHTNDTLWLATNTKSIFAYRLSTGKFIPILKPKNFEKNETLKYGHSVFELNEKYMLAGTLKNCVLIDRRTLDFFIFPLPDQSRNDYLLNVHKLENNRFLLGTFFSGILELDLTKKEIHKARIPLSFENNPVYAFHRHEEKGLFIGSEKGLFLWDINLGKIRSIYQPKIKNAIRCFYDWNNEQLLMGCFNGLIVMDKSTFETRPIMISGFKKMDFSPVEITQIKKGADGGIWFASAGKGLFYHHPKRQKFKPFRIQLTNSPKRNFISSFNFLREGNVLWMTTEFGFVKHELNTQNYKLYRTDRLGYALTKDGNNTIWGGGFNQGLQKYNRKTDQFENVVFSSGSIPDRDIVEITSFSNDSLWVSTWSSGMYVVDLTSLSVKPLKIGGKSISRARASFVDSKNRVWIGADEGLYRYKNGKTRHYRNIPDQENSLSNNRIFSISEDIHGHLWVGTAEGLNRINPETDEISRYVQQSGLPNDFIYGVLTDNNGHVWVSTNYGISQLDPITGKFRNYTEEDGLQNNEFNGKAAYKDSLGYLYFGGMNGFNIFHPDNIPTNRHTGKTIIEEVKLFGQPLKENNIYSDTLYFQHNENVLTFHFTALNFLLPKKNQYQFKMQGFDKEWRPVTSELSTTYTNLNPGTYTFYVKGSNNELIWGEPDSMSIVIRAPWYRTLIFRIGIILFILSVITGWFFYRNYEQIRKNQLLQNMVNVRTQELRESNRDLNRAMKKAREQRKNISFLMGELNHRVKNNLQLMASLLEMQKGNTQHKITKNNLQSAQNRLYTIAKIHDLLGADQSKKSKELPIFITNLAEGLIAFMEEPVKLILDLEPIKIHPKKINPLGIILNELITNTIKHAFDVEQKNREIHISLKREGKFGKLSYFDNGKGISENLKNKKSLGLKLIENLALQLGGSLELKAEKVTVFNIYFVV